MSATIAENSVGEVIKNARKSAGLTQGQLAEMADVTISTIVNVEKGHRVPREKTMRNIRQALGIHEG